MNKWKIGFFIVLLIAIITTGIQQFTIFDLKWENENKSSLIKRVNGDLESFRICFLKEYKKENFLSELKQCDPKLATFEYDLGNVKMRGIEIGFDTDRRVSGTMSQMDPGLHYKW
jgi:uncharacterized protein YpmS